MSTNEDIEHIKLEIAKKKEANHKIMQEILAKTRQHSDIAEIQKQISTFQQLKAEDEKLYQKEIKNLNLKISKMKGKIAEYNNIEIKSTISLNTVKLKALHVSYGNSVEKLFKIDQKYAELKEQSKDVIFFDQEIDRKAKIAEERCSQMEKIYPNLVPVTPFFLHLIDLRSAVTSLSRQIKEIKDNISNRRVAIEELKTMKTVQQQQIEDLDLDEDDPRSLGAVMPGLMQIKISEISQLVNSNQQVNKDYQTANNELNEIRNNRSEIINRFEEEKKELNNQIQSIEDQMMTLKEQINLQCDANKTQIIKMKQLSEQLNHKIKEMRNEILKNRSNDPEIKDLSKELEKEWRKHQIEQDNYSKKKAVLEKTRLVLEHKLRVIDDLNEWCPLSSKVKTTPGITEFMFLYDVIYTQNRNMANDTHFLQREKDDLEKDNLNLKSRLSELFSM